jgi:hypothetical protein
MKKINRNQDGQEPRWCYTYSQSGKIPANKYYIIAEHLFFMCADSLEQAIENYNKGRLL